MILETFLSIVLFSELSEKNNAVLVEKEAKIVRSLTIFVPGDPKICKCTIGKDTSVKLSENLLPPTEKKSNHLRQTSNHKINSLYMKIKKIAYY